MKNIFLILLFGFLSACNPQDLKFSQSFDDNGQEYTTKTIVTDEIINNESNSSSKKNINQQKFQEVKNLPLEVYSSSSDQNFNNKEEQETSVISPSQNPILSQQETQILKPNTAKNLEISDLQIPKQYHRKIPVALFLPFTGKYKDLGWSIFNASTLALFENDINNKIELILFDSKETIADNQKAFKEIIDRNIKVVIGPIFSNNTFAIEKLARDNDITVLSLSNNFELLNKTTAYGGIFAGGILPETQIDRIVNFAMDKGKFNFAILAPNNSYGKITTDYLKKFVRARDGNFITSEFYEANNQDIERAVSRVVNSFGVPTKSRNRDTSYLGDYDRIYPQVIFIPESGKVLSKIANIIINQNKDEKQFQLVGSTQWDDPATLKDINLLGGWFPAPEPEKFQIFIKNYYDSFGKYPPRIASLAYDFTTAIAMISQDKKNLRIEFKDFTDFSEKYNNNFTGIDGIFRFLPNGAVQRNLAVLQVGNQRFDTLENSVERFLKY
ncbi:MAG: penicillin-binding protein activator [Alphaproteobacteria bacterium]